LDEEMLQEIAGITDGKYFRAAGVGFVCWVAFASHADNTGVTSRNGKTFCPDAY